MNIDYQRLSDDLEDGTFESTLEAELTLGFRLLLDEGEALPLPSYYATRIAEVIDAGAPVPLTKETSYYVYQSVLAACEKARQAATEGV